MDTHSDVDGFRAYYLLDFFFSKKFSEQEEELNRALHDMKYNFEYDTVLLQSTAENYLKNAGLLYSSNLLNVLPSPAETEGFMFLLGVYYLYHAFKEKGLYSYGWSDTAFENHAVVRCGYVSTSARAI